MAYLSKSKASELALEKLIKSGCSELNSAGIIEGILDAEFSGIKSHGFHYLPIYWHPYYKRLGFKKGYCRNAEKYATTSFSIPIFTSLKPIQQKKIIAFVKKITKIKK